MKIAIITYLALTSLSLYGQGRYGGMAMPHVDSTAISSSIASLRFIIPDSDKKVMVTAGSTTPLFSLVEKNGGKALSINVGLNMVMRGFNRFILEDEYAQISLRSMRNNLTTLPVWDTNKFSTNFIGHPYHGSMYFNSARSNGYDFYRSLYFTMGGSLMWEYLMETKPPSRNDLGATIAGGMAVGEISYRLSDLLLDNRSTGMERVGRELLGAFLSPTRFITRLTTGEAWKARHLKGNHLYQSPYLLELYLGETTIDHGDSRWDLRRFTIGSEMQYGEIYQTVVEKPYEWFLLEGEAEVTNSRLHLKQVGSLGLIRNKELFHTDRTWTTAGLFQHFNYYNLHNGEAENMATPFYLSEAVAIGPGVQVHKRKDHRHASFGTYLSGIALGAVISDYFKLEERDYNYASGFSLKIISDLQIKENWRVSFFAGNWVLFSWKELDKDIVLDDLTSEQIDFLNVQGDRSKARLHLLEVNMRYKLSERVHFILRARNIFRNTTYHHYPTTSYSSRKFFFGLGVYV